MKRLKTHIIKISAFIIGMIYILIPIHTEVKSVLHSLSHSIESIGLFEHHEHNHGHNHHNHLSEVTVPDHDHKIIDLLDSLLGASDYHTDTETPNKLDLELEYHFYSPKHVTFNLTLNENTLANNVYKAHVKDGFYPKIKEPPKFS